MAEHIQIDDDPVCFAVDYHEDLNEAKAHFENWGFDGITNLEVVNNSIGCNDARVAAINAAKEQGAKCFYVGNYDCTIGRNCILFKFNYEGYHGSKNPQNAGDAPYFIGNVK